MFSFIIQSIGISIDSNFYTSFSNYELLKLSNKSQLINEASTSGFNVSFSKFLVFSWYQ